MKNIDFRGESAALTCFATHVHPGMDEITYQLSGNAVITMGSESFRVKAGDVMITPAYMPHSGECDGGVFTDMCVKAKNIGFNSAGVVHDSDGSILKLMEMIYRVTTERADGYREIAESLLEAVCAYIRKYMNKKSRYEFVDSFKNVIFENLSNPDFNISDEIKKSGYTADHFRRCFKDDTGKTPVEYITDLRINRAKKQLISHPPQSVESIAEGCGFNDVFYFSRVFKKKTGLSPREYRKERM